MIGMFRTYLAHKCIRLAIWLDTEAIAEMTMDVLNIMAHMHDLQEFRNADKSVN